MDYEQFIRTTVSVLDDGPPELAIRTYVPVLVIPATQTLAQLQGMPGGGMGRVALLRTLERYQPDEGPAFLAFRDGSAVYVVQVERSGGPEGAGVREQWRRIVAVDGELVVEAALAPSWWRDEAAALALVGDVVGPVRFAGSGWSMQLPEGWTGLYGEEEPDCVTPPGDEAVLQITCYESEQPVTIEDVRRSAQYIRGEPQPVRLGPFEGIAGPFRDPPGMPCWIVGHGHRLLFMTWTVEEGARAPEVVPVLETLRGW
jgi:hypothetical protein